MQPERFGNIVRDRDNLCSRRECGLEQRPGAWAGRGGGDERGRQGRGGGREGSRGRRAEGKGQGLRGGCGWRGGKTWSERNSNDGRDTNKRWSFCTYHNVHSVHSVGIFSYSRACDKNEELLTTRVFVYGGWLRCRRAATRKVYCMTAALRDNYWTLEQFVGSSE